MKILLVEDDPDIRDVISELLMSEGYRVSVAEDGLEAKELIEDGAVFDLLVSDFRMPRWSGADLLNWCRKNQIHFPVIFISATSTLLEGEQLALADCCAELLKKPLDLDDLLRSVQIALVRNHNQDCDRTLPSIRPS